MLYYNSTNILKHVCLTYASKLNDPKLAKSPARFSPIGIVKTSEIPLAGYTVSMRYAVTKLGEVFLNLRGM